jgi:hypothetical protein
MQLLKAVVFVAALIGQAHAQSIDDAAWLAGRWVGEGFGGQMEEAWAPPVGGQMVGHFRHWRDGEPRFYEIMLLDVVEGGVRMRVKHFNPDFTAWEDRGEWTTFAPVSASPEALIFSGLEIRRSGEDDMVMTLRIRRGDTVTDEILRFTRATL